MKRNKLFIPLFILLFSLTTRSFGQAAGYSLSAFSGTFTPITGGANIATIESDDASSIVELPFTFEFDGVSYDTVKVNSNGTINFNLGATSNLILRTNDLASPGANMAPMICPLWDDLDGGTPANAKFEWLTTGTSPNRIVTFEWLNWEWNWNAVNEVISFQVKLYETTNVIEFIYRQETNTPNSPSASIGLSGISTFLSLQSSGTTPATSIISSQNNITTRPATNQVYQFTPPACFGSTDLAQDSATSNSINLSWTAGAGSFWQVEYGPVGFTPGTGNVINVTSASNLSVSGLASATCYDFYVRDSCGPGNASSFFGPIRMCTVFPTPYFESFDSNTPLGLGASAQAIYYYKNGWRSESIVGSFNFLSDNNNTAGGGGPGKDHTTGSGTFIYAESSTPAKIGDQAMLVSPYLDLTGMTNPILRLWYHRQGTPIDGQSVEIDDGTGWTVLDDTTLLGATHTSYAVNDPWKKLQLSLLGYSGVVRFRILAKHKGCCSDAAIDDFEVFDLMDDDARVMAITKPQEGGCEGSYTVEIDVQNNGLDTISSINASYRINGGSAITETFSVSILPSNTMMLSFNKMANFSKGNTIVTAWTDLAGDNEPGNDTISKSISMVQVIDTIIYCESFENGNGGWTSGGLNSSWDIGTPAGTYIPSAARGSRAAVTNLTGNYNSNELSYLLSPCFDFTAYDKDPTIEFSHIYRTEANFDNTYMEISTDGGNSWVKLGNSATGINWYSNAGGRYWEGTHTAGSGNWQRARHQLNGVAGKADVKIRFVLDSDLAFNFEGVGVDSIVIVSPPYDQFSDTVSNCGDSTFTLDASGAYGTNAIYKWNTGESTPTISNVTPGTYSVTITDSKLGISTTESMVVITTNPPNVQFASAIDTISAFGLPVVINLSPKLSDDLIYQWEVNGVITNYPFFIADPTELIPGTNVVTVNVTDEYLCTTIDSHQVYVSGLVGVQSIGQSNIQVYPNPASEQVNIEVRGNQSLGRIELILLDYQGRSIYQSQLNDNSGHLRTTLDVSSFSSGIYILQLKTQKGILNHKLVIE